MKKTLLVAIACFIIFAWVIDAKNIYVNGSETTRSIKCQNDDVYVNGSENKVTLTGICSNLYVSGSENTVRVEKVGSIVVSGVENTVIWENGINGAPTILNQGQENKVKKSGTKADAGSEEAEDSGDDVEGAVDDIAGALSQLGGLGGNTSKDSQSSEGQIELNGNHQNKTVNLDGKDLIVAGNYLHVTAKGTCHLLKVLGNYCTITIETVAHIEALGNHNEVVWEKSPNNQSPSISNLGNKNRVTHKED